MSRIDTSMSGDLRGTLLAEVRAFLPAFLSSETRERADRVAASSELLGLPEAELRRALAVHIMLAEDTRAFVADLAQGVRRPVTSSTRPRVAGRTVNSGIDWAATVRHVATANPAGGEWVTRPANRIFDLPENRALAWVLTTLIERAQVAAPESVGSLAAWAHEIQQSESKMRASSQVSWLEGVPAQWPGDMVYGRLAADRLGFYRNRLARVARRLRRMLVDPDPQALVDALCDRYFEPTQDWKLFEIGVLLRLCSELDSVATRVTRRAAFDGGEFARYRLNSGREARIWYQAWPRTDESSELREAAAYYGVSASNRPDITVELRVDGAHERTIVLELKASSSSGYLGSGLSQLQGYLRDRPKFTGQPASGWLVAPPGAGYTSKPAADRSLWVVSSDDVAGALAAAALG